jgi:hypothetical protein
MLGGRSGSIMNDRDYDNDELETPKWECKKCGEDCDDCNCK